MPKIINIVVKADDVTSVIQSVGIKLSIDFYHLIFDKSISVKTFKYSGVFVATDHMYFCVSMITSPLL